jgi:hypothetical protein
LRVFGVGPLALLRMFPRGFGTIMHHSGTVKLQPAADGNGTEAIFRDLAPPLRATAFVMSMGALFEALFEVARRPGIVTADASRLDIGVLRYVLRAVDREGLVSDVEEI